MPVYFALRFCWAQLTSGLCQVRGSAWLSAAPRAVFPLFLCPFPFPQVSLLSSWFTRGQKMPGSETLMKVHDLNSLA